MKTVFTIEKPALQFRLCFGKLSFSVVKKEKKEGTSSCVFVCLPFLYLSLPNSWCFFNPFFFLPGHLSRASCLFAYLFLLSSTTVIVFCFYEADVCACVRVSG